MSEETVKVTTKRQKDLRKSQKKMHKLVLNLADAIADYYGDINPGASEDECNTICDRAEEFLQVAVYLNYTTSKRELIVHLPSVKE